MTYPNFFDDIEKIVLKDELANFLGATKDGIVEFKYIDIVKSAGHSCPTVLGAYLMTLKGLKELYKNELPKRGEIKVEFSESIESGVTGVIANVITNITGATNNSGFKGLMGLYSRNNLMSFGKDIVSSVRFTRVDTNEIVDVIYNPTIIPAKSEMSELMQKCLSKNATDIEIKEFQDLWQNRVYEISKNINRVIKII